MQEYIDYRSVNTYFIDGGTGMLSLPVKDNVLTVTWPIEEHGHDARLNGVFCEKKLIVAKADHRLLVAFDGHIIPRAFSRRTTILASWKWPEFNLCDRTDYYPPHFSPPPPAWKADSGHVIVPLERHLLLTENGDLAFLRWDRKSIRRMVTLCSIRVDAHSTKVTWTNTSP